MNDRQIVDLPAPWHRPMPGAPAMTRHDVEFAFADPAPLIWAVGQHFVTPAVKLTMISLMSFYDVETHIAEPSLKQIAKRAGVSVQTARRALQEMTEHKVIKRELQTNDDGGNGTWKYEVPLFKQWFEDELELEQQPAADQ